MLVLTRKIGESVVIGEAIYCTVVGYRDGEVRLAFAAPQSIAIHREEIQRRIYKERQNTTAFPDSPSSRKTVVEHLLSQLNLGVPLTKNPNEEGVTK